VVHRPPGVVGAARDFLRGARSLGRSLRTDVIIAWGQGLRFQELSEWVRVNQSSHPRGLKRFPEIALDRTMEDPLPWYRTVRVWLARATLDDERDAS
jgi:hypothetical protein